MFRFRHLVRFQFRRLFEEEVQIGQPNSGHRQPLQPSHPLEAVQELEKRRLHL